MEKTNETRTKEKDDNVGIVYNYENRDHGGNKVIKGDREKAVTKKTKTKTEKTFCVKLGKRSLRDFNCL